MLTATYASAREALNSCPFGFKGLRRRFAHQGGPHKAFGRGKKPSRGKRRRAGVKDLEGLGDPARSGAGVGPAGGGAWGGSHRRGIIPRLETAPLGGWPESSGTVLVPPRLNEPVGLLRYAGDPPLPTASAGG